jgi:kynurenine formamidase
MLVDGADFAAGARRGPNGFQFADDHLSMALHSGTHLDALSHVARDGLMYNDIPATEVRSRSGAHRLGIENVGGIVCRGVLIDIKTTGTWQPSRVITKSDLEHTLQEAGAKLEPGDGALIRTGWLVRMTNASDEDLRVSPGISLEAAHWLADQGVVLVGADNPAVEVLSAETETVMPVHLALLQERGVYLLEFANLEGLAAAGASTFILVIAPLPITGAVGSPVNPIAIL